MSVRATERLIGDLVAVTGLPGSPVMVVKGINEETKLITAVWFGDCQCFQEGVFPAQALDRAEANIKPSAKTSKTKNDAKTLADKRKKAAKIPGAREAKGKKKLLQ